jgi:hypothetical protein
MAQNVDRWLKSWLFRRRSVVPDERHIFITICDHYAPLYGAGKALAIDRVRRWEREYQKHINEFRDSDGIPPKHTFFYPIEQWDLDVCGPLVEFCRDVGSEVELHLHHDNDTAENLTLTLQEGLNRFGQLGCLAKDRQGDIAYGFIHGNWALDHSHPEGRACGVPTELAILRQTGCYADFTLPSAPSRCQVPTINAIYYAREDGLPSSHARGIRARVGHEHQERNDDLLLITGPLGLNWRQRQWGLLPTVENSAITHAAPPTPERLDLWEKCHIHVEGRPEWIFIKLHTHGAGESNANMLLGEPMRAFHRHLKQRAAKDAGFSYHYVTAREMANLVHAAEAGESGNPNRFRDYFYQLNDGTAKLPRIPVAAPKPAAGHTYWPSM